MSELTLDPTHQLVIIARLGEFCQFRGATLYHEKDPWLYMRGKLSQTEEPLVALKAQLLAATKKHLLAEMRAGPVTDDRFADFKTLLERLLSRGDFVDLAIHLNAAAGKDALKWIEPIIGPMKATNLFAEEKLPAEQRNPSWEKLIKELGDRIYLDTLAKTLTRKPRTAFRKRMVLRKLRASVAEYCTVMHIPLSAADTFTPFMLPRVEALIAANMRFLNKYR
jgi:hypothetical protein